MMYSRLTKEQFEELHQEFAKFLATQSITSDDWKKIKSDQPDVAEDVLDVFSDLIWESVLSKAKYLENIAAQQLFLFKLNETEIHLIMIKVNDTTMDITTETGFAWLQQNFTSDEVELFTASKIYSEVRNKDVFDLVLQGAEISDGELYEMFVKLI